MGTLKAAADGPADVSAAPPPPAPPPAPPLPAAYLPQPRDAAALHHPPGEPSTAPPGRAVNWAERPDSYGSTSSAPPLATAA